MQYRSLSLLYRYCFNEIGTLVISMRLSKLFFALCILIPPTSFAGVGLKQSRVILNEDIGSAIINIESKDSYPNLIESWVSNPNDNSKTPHFLVTPPLFKLNAGDTAELKIVNLGAHLPADRESVFFLNVKNIAQSVRAESKLQIAINNRIKLLYRPVALAKLDIASSAKNIEWHASRGALLANNNSPFVVNFFSIAINGKVLEGQYYAPPFSAITLETKARPGDIVSWQVINDYGSPAARGETTVR